MSVADEENHIHQMMKKWGVHCWYNMVNDTKDDCDIAKMIRYEEQFIESCKINNIIVNETKLDFERERIFRRVEREKYINEQKKEKEIVVNNKDDYLVQEI
jgi:hypothetical protein